MRLFLLGACSALATSLGCRDAGTGPAAGAGAPRIVWHTVLPASGSSYWLGRPATEGGRVFVQDGTRLLGLDAATGGVLWSRAVRAGSTPAPTTLRARAGRVYVSETDSVLAVDGASGGTVWSFHPDSQAVVVPALDATTFYTGQRGVPVVYALGIDDGAVRWRVNVGTGYRFLAYVQGLAVSGDTVYVSVARDLAANGGQQTGVLVALDRRDGHELWRYETASTADVFLREPIVAGRLVIVDDFRAQTIVAVDVATRQEAWRVRLPNNGASRVTLSGGTLYVAGAGGVAAAIDAATGAVHWQKTGYGGAFGGEYCGGAFFMTDERLIRFDAASGRETGRATTGDNNTFTSDVTTDGNSVFFTGSGGAYAVACR